MLRAEAGTLKQAACISNNACSSRSSYCELSRTRLRDFLSPTDDATVLSVTMVSDFLQDSQRTLGCFKTLKVCFFQSELVYPEVVR